MSTFRARIVSTPMQESNSECRSNYNLSVRLDDRGHSLDTISHRAPFSDCYKVYRNLHMFEMIAPVFRFKVFQVVGVFIPFVSPYDLSILDLISS